MTIFTRNTLADLESFIPQSLGDCVRWRVTGRAASVRRRLFDSQCIGYLFGTRRGEGGKRALRVKILQRPDQILVFILASPAVTTGTAARSGAEKFERAAGLNGFRGRQSNGQSPQSYRGGENTNVRQSGTN